jgi:hypothetical protein
MASLVLQLASGLDHSVLRHVNMFFRVSGASRFPTPEAGPHPKCWTEEGLGSHRELDHHEGFLLDPVLRARASFKELSIRDTHFSPSPEKPRCSCTILPSGPTIQF